MNKRFLLSILTILLLISVATATTSESYSINYTNFNSQTATWQATKSTWTNVQITTIWELTFNSTYGGSYGAEIQFMNETGTSKTGIAIITTRLNDIDIYWYDGSGSGTLINGESDTKTTDEYVVVTLYNGYLDVGNQTDTDKWVSDFVSGDLEINYYGTKGDTVLTTAGYVSITLEDPPVSISLDTTLQIIYAVIPLIFTVAVIGVILDMFKKVSK